MHTGPAAELLYTCEMLTVLCQQGTIYSKVCDCYDPRDCVAQYAYTIDCQLRMVAVTPSPNGF